MGKFNLTIEEDLKRKAKAKAALEGRDLSDVISDLLRPWVEGALHIPSQEQRNQEASNERPAATG